MAPTVGCWFEVDISQCHVLLRLEQGISEGLRDSDETTDVAMITRTCSTLANVLELQKEQGGGSVNNNRNDGIKFVDSTAVVGYGIKYEKINEKIKRVDSLVRGASFFTLDFKLGSKIHQHNTLQPLSNYTKTA